MLFMFAFSSALGMGCSSTELSERSSQVPRDPPPPQAFPSALAFSRNTLPPLLSLTLPYSPSLSCQNLANYHLKDAAVMVGSCIGPLLAAFVSQQDKDPKSQQDLLVAYAICAVLCFSYVPLYYKVVYSQGDTIPKEI